MNHFAAVIGQMNIDFIFHEVDSLPEPGEEVFSNNFKITLGGGPMVIPFHLNRLGVPTRFGTFVGDDFESEIAKNLLATLNYSNVEYFRHPNSRPIVVTSVLATATERSFICFNQNIDESVLDDATLLSFYRGSKVAYLPRKLEVARELAEQGCKLILDVAWDPKMTISDLAPKLELVTYFTPNDKEAKQICGESDLLRCLDLLGAYVETPIIKLGKNGSLVKSEGNYLLVPGLENLKSIDPTGAGDNFLVGLIFGMHQELDFVTSVRFGNVVGGLSTQLLGCYQPDLTREIIMSEFAKLPEPILVSNSTELNTLLNRM